MNKNAIQKYAIWARNELIEQIKQRAYQYGIDDKGYGDANAAVIAGRVLSAEEQRQRREFVVQIEKNGYQQSVEEVAYTWFNRFVALRFMEVNDYLPSHIRVFSDANGEFNPEILKQVLHLDLPGLDKAKVSELLNSNQTEELYRYLLLTQCNALNVALPEMFEKLGSYTEMLLPNNILRQDSVLARLVKDIPEDDWRDAVQIIGWLYQYYNTEPKQAVFDGLKKNAKITKEKIPAATQLFTPDWIVRYMVENSLGRLWLESHPNSGLKVNWAYYLDEAEQTPEVEERLRVLRSQSPVKSPEDIRLIDPCMGSGHILVYAFDVLMQIYQSEGYNPRDAAKLILKKNLYGLDIDRRAYQLAYFALMMKARQYNRRIFTEDIKPQVYHPAGFPDGEEYGSLVRIDKLPPQPAANTGQLNLDDGNYTLQLNAWNFKHLLAQKYDVVVTNPPYMGSKGMSAKMSEFVKKNYPDSKSDLFAVFIEKCGELLKTTGYQAMITQHAWMFLSSYEKLRGKLLLRDIINMAHLGARAFEEIGGEVVQTTTFVLARRKIAGYKGHYARLVNFGNQNDKEAAFLGGEQLYSIASENFGKIPGNPIAYWMRLHVFDLFASNPSIKQFVSYHGILTGKDELFIRLWWEPSFTKLNTSVGSKIDFEKCAEKFYPLAKGGEFRRYYGNNDLVIWYDKEGQSLINKMPTHGFGGSDYYFSDGITWSELFNNNFSARKMTNSIFSLKGPSLFADKPTLSYILALFNTKVSNYLLGIINPTISTGVGVVSKLPFIYEKSCSSSVETMVDKNTCLCRADWDSFETSWDFRLHPLVELKEGSGYGIDRGKWNYTIKSAFENWGKSCNDRFGQLKANEEELNRIFIDIYGLQDELTPEVAHRDVTVHRIYDSKEDIPKAMVGSRYALTKQDVIKSLISYAVGCMFGRYSLDTEGLAYAGGDWDASKYRTFVPDKDNVIPICDDEYFDDDIVGRFVEFVRVVYGAETLEQNLEFIADALGGNGSPRDVLRSYFLKGFYKDHCKTYQKRPIYWLFDSGRRNGFKALVYLHRYSHDLLARLRTDYVHEQQERYRTQLAHIVAALSTATGAERARLLRQQDKLTKQSQEIGAYEERIHHLADMNIEMDLDDGVKKNYQIFADVLAKI